MASHEAVNKLSKYLDKFLIDNWATFIDRVMWQYGLFRFMLVGDTVQI